MRDKYLLTGCDEFYFLTREFIFSRDNRNKIIWLILSYGYQALDELVCSYVIQALS
jgi:hypothetical protein